MFVPDGVPGTPSARLPNRSDENFSKKESETYMATNSTAPFQPSAQQVKELRERTGAEASSSKPPFKLPERVPGPAGTPGPRDLYDPDIVVHSRDFR